MKVRQDAWTEEDDLLLAETVLRHVREGSTQLNAFEEVGDKLDRTSAACGFRWNAVVRHSYEKALQLALREKPDLVILQSRSPSCGVNEVYDGTFSGKLVPGKGLFAKAACENGFCVTDVKDYLRSCDDQWKKS